MSPTNSDHKIDQYRRKFLAQSAVVAGLSIAPGIVLNQVAHAKADSDKASDENRWGMLIDTNKCSKGCTDCVTACKTENGWGSLDGKASSETHSSKEQQAQWIRKVTITDKQTGHVQSLPLMCQHCETAPCVDV